LQSLSVSLAVIVEVALAAVMSVELTVIATRQHKIISKLTINRHKVLALATAQTWQCHIDSYSIMSLAVTVAR